MRRVFMVRTRIERGVTTWLTHRTLLNVDSSEELASPCGRLKADTKRSPLKPVALDKHRKPQSVSVVSCHHFGVTCCDMRRVLFQLHGSYATENGGVGGGGGAFHGTRGPLSLRGYKR